MTPSRRKVFLFSYLLSFLLCLIFPLPSAYAELTARQQEIMDEFYKRNKEFSRAGPVPLKELVQHEKFSKALDKYGDLLLAIDTLKKVRETEDFEVFQDGMWRLEKAGGLRSAGGFRRLKTKCSLCPGLLPGGARTFG